MLLLITAEIVKLTSPTNVALFLRMPVRGASENEPMTKPTNKRRQSDETTERLDSATSRLFKHDPHALAMQTEARKRQRQQKRREWWDKNKPA